jgi:hypothetical protein
MVLLVQLLNNCELGFFTTIVGWRLHLHREISLQGRGSTACEIVNHLKNRLLAKWKIFYFISVIPSPQLVDYCTCGNNTFPLHWDFLAARFKDLKDIFNLNKIFWWIKNIRKKFSKSMPEPFNRVCIDIWTPKIGDNKLRFVVDQKSIWGWKRWVLKQASAGLTMTFETFVILFKTKFKFIVMRAVIQGWDSPTLL